jgi:choline dehydrogenase-like flavoprotein
MTGAAAPPGWSEAELETLVVLAEAFVPGQASRRALMAAEAFDLGLDPHQVRQLKLALRLLESRPANAVLAGRPVRLGDLDAESVDRYLVAWGGSRFALRRSAFQAFRRLLSFLAYADPGDDGNPNPNLAAIGYAQDDPGTTDAPTPIMPLRLPPPRGNLTEPLTLDADVVIVGSGAGGGVVARALAEAGRSVVVVEAGPFVAEPDMPRSELDGFDRLYRDHGLTATWDGSVSILAGAVVGGGTTVNWMTTIAAPDAVRSGWARAHGIAGFDATEGDADFAAIAAELSATECVVRSPKDDALAGGATELGLESGPTVRDATDCQACGSCLFGCRAGAKQSGLRAHLADAYRSGARILADARVERVIIEGGRAVGVEATVGWQDPSARTVAAGVAPVERRTVVVRARQVVVAAGGLGTPVILERSGVGHPALGRYLLLHPVPVVAGLFAEPIDMWRGPLQATRSLAHVDAVRGRNGYVVESAPGHPGLIALALPWEGQRPSLELMAQVRFVAPFIAVTRDGGTGRVRATASGGARIDYRLDRVGVTTLRHGLATMVRIARAAGARELVAAGTPAAWHRIAGQPAGVEPRKFEAFVKSLDRFDFGPNRGTVFSAHQMGTARFGVDPKTHVCDPFGRVRAGSSGGRDAVIPGLYVADTSLFPTGLGVNPMLTAMVLARRVGRTVLAEG